VDRRRLIEGGKRRLVLPQLGVGGPEGAQDLRFAAAPTELPAELERLGRVADRVGRPTQHLVGHREAVLDSGERLPVTLSGGRCEPRLGHG
jgi:hypothetical protein